MVVQNMYLELTETNTFKFPFFECLLENSRLDRLRLIKILKAVIKHLLNCASVLDDNYGM